MRRIRSGASLALAVVISGCAGSKPAPPLTYLSLETPKGSIQVPTHPGVNRTFSRGGFYVLNSNFRPAADVEQYVREAQKEAGSTVLRGADIELAVPFAIDILFFGYNSGTDTVRATGQ
jgi:hypothetical protein